jgi:hypothetical protein
MQKRDEVAQFEIRLRQLVLVLEPLARACKCLESAQSTPADIYLFWLAVLATYENLFSTNNDADGLQLPEEVVEEIRKVVNARWEMWTTGPEKKLYISTLFLNYRTSCH